MSWISDELAGLEAAGLRRYPQRLDSAQGPDVEIDGRTVVLLCSNNYLGLAADPRVARAAANAALRWGAGSGASRLVSGTTSLHLELERALAEHKGCEDAVLFSSGYLANIGTISALVGPDDAVFSDELNHASIIDGCRLSGAERVVYRHADPFDLARALAGSRARRRLVVTDTVFSMDGDLAPLREIADVCAQHDAMLMVDEAHATGLLGPLGAGAAFGLPADVVMGTLSKSLGSAGGFVAGRRDLVALLRNRARTHVFDTAPAPASLGAALEALRIVRAEPWRGERALAVARRLAERLRDLGYRASDPAAAVVPVGIGEPGPAVELSTRLLEEGVFVPAIRPPSVPAGTAPLRVCAMATHTDEHVARALEAFASARGARRATRRPARRARGLFVTGTDTGVGKTVVAAAIALAARLRGLRVAALKPAQTGSLDGADDAGFIRRFAGIAEAVTPFVLREPLAPAVAARIEHTTIDLDDIVRVYEELSARNDLVIVEGAGGLLVPLNDEATMGDLAARLDLPLVVVARPGLGTINHTALTVEAARARGLRIQGIVLSGLPDAPSLAEATNPPEIERLTGVPIAGVVPFIEGIDVDRGVFPAGLDPRPWLDESLYGSLALEHRRLNAAPA